MSKNEKIKEQISYLKFCFGIIIAIIVSITGYIFNQFEKMNFWLLLISFIFDIILIIVVFVLMKFISKNINSLEDL